MFPVDKIHTIICGLLSLRVASDTGNTDGVMCQYKTYTHRRTWRNYLLCHWAWLLWPGSSLSMTPRGPGESCSVRILALIFFLVLPWSLVIITLSLYITMEYVGYNTYVVLSLMFNNTLNKIWSCSSIVLHILVRSCMYARVIILL